MFQKKYKQFLAATLSAAMLIGQVQYANAADPGENVIDLTEEDALELVPTDDVPELTEEDVQKYLETDEEIELLDVELPTEDEEEASDDVVNEEFEENLNEDSTDELELLDETSDEEADLEEEVADTLSAELPEGIVGMAEDYELTESELSIKEDAIDEKDTYFDDFAALVEGEDYAKDEVVFLSETKEHAEEVAAAYAGTLKSFENGVAVIDLSESEVSVEEAYSCAFVEDVNLPVVTPNYFFTTDELAEVDEDYLGTKKVNPVEETAEESSVEEAAEVNEASDETEAEEADEFDGEETAAGVAVPYVEETEEEASEETTEDNFINEPYLEATADEYQWQHEMVDSYTAWLNLGREGLSKTSNVVVAVIDDGIADVSELNVVNETGFDGNHGTLVAGVIGAALDENGGAGVAPGVQLLNLKTDFTAASVMTQLRAAVDGNAAIINMSFEGAYVDPQFQSVIDEVYAAGVTMVAAAGNGTTYPAACENVIAVAAVNEAGKVASYASDSDADIAAPGSNIWTTDVDGSYVMVSGSALASSVVAGAAALYVAEFGPVTPDAMRDVLVNTAETKDGVNVVNVRNLLEGASVNLGGADTKLKASGKPKKIIFYQNGKEVKSGVIGTTSSNKLLNYANITAKTDTGLPVTFTWASKAEKKARIDHTTNGVKVTSYGLTGSIKLKATAGGKKKTFTVKIINPIVGLDNNNIKIPGLQHPDKLANGGSYKIKVKTVGANGKKPTKGKLKWVAIVSVGGNTLDPKDAKKVATCSGGKTKAKGNAWTWLRKNGYGTNPSVSIVPVAYSNDGTEYAWTFSERSTGKNIAFRLTYRPKSPFGFSSGATYSMSRKSSPQVWNEFTVKTYRGPWLVSVKTSYIVCYSEFSVTSSNTSVLNVSCVYMGTEVGTGRPVYGIRFAPTGKSGDAYVYVKTMDGTHMSTSSKWQLR